MLLADGHGCGGEVALILRPREGTGLLVHQVKKQPAKVWRTDLGLAPSHAPELAVAPAGAVVELRQMKASPPPAGPATLRGRWSGALQCNDGVPSVTLERKVASYGTLRLASKPDGRWAATFERSEKWFSKAKAESIERSALAEAIEAGMGLVIGLVSEACSFRDTRRRNTVDPTYAAQHPYAPPRERKDPTERLKASAAPVYSLRGDAAGFDVLDLSGNVVARFGAREKGKAEKHLRALNRGGTAPPVPGRPLQTDPVFSAPAADRGPSSLNTVHEPEPPSCPNSVARIASSLDKEAQALVEMSDSLWGSTEAPDMLNRAARLIKHAHSLVSSPLCRGKEQKAAFEDIRRAGGAYQQAWEAIGRGEKPDIVTTLRRIAERVSLAAARAAKSCAAGQQKLAPPARTTEDVSRGIEAREQPRETVPMQPVWPPAAPPQSVPTTKPPRSRKARETLVDPEKDKALMSAFADAIKTAAQQMGGGA